MGRGGKPPWRLGTPAAIEMQRWATERGPGRGGLGTVAVSRRARSLSGRRLSRSPEGSALGRLPGQPAVRQCSTSRGFRRGRAAVARDLWDVEEELAEVKGALRCEGSFLGMTGSLLQEYAVELAKKENLLRLALSQAATVGSRGPAYSTSRRPAGARGSGPLNFDAAARAASAPAAWATLWEMPRRRSEWAPATHREPPVVEDEVPAQEATAVTKEPLTTAAPSTALPPPLPTTPVVVQEPSAGNAEPARWAEAPSGAGSAPALYPEHGVTVASGNREQAEAEARAGAGSGVTAAAVAKEQLDSSSLAEVLQLLEAHPSSERVQRAGLHALGRLARDRGQLQPLCLAAVGAVARVADTFRGSCAMQRLAVSTLGNIAYVPAVAKLIVHEALPTIFAAMVAHGRDAKLHGLACEALARLAQAGTAAILKAGVQTMLTHEDRSLVSVCCGALLRLGESGIGGAADILDVLLPLSESQPANLELQHRASLALQLMVRDGAVDGSTARRRAAPLLSAQWAHLLARFLGAEAEEAKLDGAFHAEVQVLFHEEVLRHFEYEASERCSHLLAHGASGTHCLREVLRCLVENLEDYCSRLDARELAWDAAAGRLVRLDGPLRRRLAAEALAAMEAGLLATLRAVAAAATAGTPGRGQLAERTARLRAECAALLDRKTEATQAHQELATELRREVMLFEAVEYLELQEARGEAGATQVRSALHMLDLAAPVAPADALERLRERLGGLAARAAAAAGGKATRGSA